MLLFMTHEAHYVSTDFKMFPLDTRFSDIEIRCGDMVICSEIKPYSSERHEWCRITKNLGQGSATLHNKSSDAILVDEALIPKDGAVDIMSGSEIVPSPGGQGYLQYRFTVMPAPDSRSQLFKMLYYYYLIIHNSRLFKVSYSVSLVFAFQISIDHDHAKCIDYVSKWVEAIASPTNDARVVTKMFKTIIFPRFGVPRVVISDGVVMIINKIFAGLLKKKGVQHKLDNALWAYRTAYKTPIGTTPYNLVYGKACHLPVELEYKTAWAVKLLNFDIKPAAERQSMQIHELEEIRHLAYERSKIYKERTKAYHDKRIINCNFQPKDQVLLFNSRLRLFPGKLRSKWSGPFTIKEVHPHGAVVLLNTKGKEFVVNGQRIKPYLAETTTAEVSDFSEHLLREDSQRKNNSLMKRILKAITGGCMGAPSTHEPRQDQTTPRSHRPGKESAGTARGDEETP
ncbi:PREDICTED: uncharacterized protein LOC106337984 [Brassica oleracea var. oleracea]|uniref:uncharacterized protein LOC106337984 n=1 Tax=Brassica oleracea var. oleracea TaxID=109376 RepID=UPI0006A6F7AD|nr:PREDICTED: uncharacterized protein LOC106337984 [Brassica oleracea var. oleracea]